MADRKVVVMGNDGSGKAYVGTVVEYDGKRFVIHDENSGETEKFTPSELKKRGFNIEIL